MENRVVIDTNVMVSFLIGKRLRKLKDKLSDSSIKLILTKQLIDELKFKFDNQYGIGKFILWEVT